MFAKYVCCMLATCFVGCTPLLEADFDELSPGTLPNGTVNLPGSPNGDQMVVASRGGDISIEDGVFEQQHLRIPTGDPLPAVTFRPVRGASDSRIFISYSARITGTAAGRIVFHNLDAEGGADDVPDMTLDFLQEDAQLGEAPTTPTGWKMNGITGEHNVLLSIDPDGWSFNVLVTGDDLNNSPNIFQFSSTDGAWRANPPNFEVTFTTAPGEGSGSYQIDNLLISEV